MAISAVIAIGAVAGAAYSGYQTKKGAEKQANATKEAAVLQADTEKEIAAKQQQQAAENLKFQQEQERVRQQAQQAQLAEQRRQSADAAVKGLADDNEPVVQLANTGGAADPFAKNKRRAQFRPEYASGVTI